MAKRSELMKIIAVSIVFLVLISGFSVIVYGSGSEKSISPYDISGNSSNNTVIANIKVGSGPYAVAYDPSNGYVYVANWYSNNVSVINGATNKVIANIAVGSEPEGVAYDSSNGYVYVANEGSNSVSVINGANNTVIVSIAVGSGPCGVAYDFSNGYVYVANVNSNDVSVINGTTNTVIASIAVGSGPGDVAYDSSNRYIYVTNWNSGTVSIISTSPQVIKKYSVTFTESGLPTGTSWSVTFNGKTETSTTNIISFTEPNGTYSFSIASINGYSVSPSSGRITVNGANVNQAITFTAVTTSLYTITFTESGLPSGASWSITLNGTTKSSTTNTITFKEPNGTYSYTISTEDKNYAPVALSGTFTVNGANGNQTITFTAVTTLTTVTTPTNYLLYIIIVIVVIIAVLGVVMAMRRGKNKGGPKQWQEPPKQQPPQQ